MRVRFDGVDDKISIASGIITSYPFTIMVRFRLVNTGAGEFVFGQSNTGSNGSFVLFRDAGGVWEYSLRAESGPTPNATGWYRPRFGTPDTNDHTLVVLSRSDSEHEVYMDGVLIDSSTVQVNFPNSPNLTSLAYWQRSASNGFGNVEISEFAMWNTDLSANESISLSGTKQLGKVKSFASSNIQFYTDMRQPTVNVGDSVDGLTFTDLSGNSNDMTADDGGNNTGLTAEAETYFAKPNIAQFLTEAAVVSQITFEASPVDIQTDIPEPTVIIDTLVQPDSVDITLETIEVANIGNLVVVTPNSIDINTNVLDPAIQTETKVEVSAVDIQTEPLSPTFPVQGSFISKLVSINPLIAVTDTSPARIIKIDTSDPENLSFESKVLTGIDNAKDVSIGFNNDYVYVAGDSGQIVKVLIADLTDQTIIDVSDADNLLNIETNTNYGITYAGTDNDTGELYLIDERSTFSIDSILHVIAPQTVNIDSSFYITPSFKMDSNINVLAKNSFKINTDFKCLTNSLDDITPIGLKDFQVFIDGVELSNTDLVLDSIIITHSIEQESLAEFQLTRRHDELNTTLNGETITITNQNSVVIKIDGVTEFEGKISRLTGTYNEDSENVLVEALADEKTNQFNNITLSLPGINSRLKLYDVLIQSPNIFNPAINPDNENPKKFLGVKVNLGEEVVQRQSRFTIFDSIGAIAEDIQEGSFNPKPNWTYFWSPTVRKFGTFVIGETVGQTFSYIGTSLSPVTEDLWELTNAKHRRQRVFEDKVTRVGTTGIITVGELKALNLSESGQSIFNELQSKGYINGSGVIQPSFINSIFSSEDLNINFPDNTKNAVYSLLNESVGYYVGNAPFKTVSARNGRFKPSFRWVDESDGLYSIKEAGYDFEDFVKTVADLEFEQLKNINGDILPETSCAITTTVDAYLFYNISLLTRINIDNTTTLDIYNNNNGFPVSVKSITIASSDRRVVLTTDNLKSNKELEELNDKYPDETDDEYNTKSQRIFLAAKSDMRTGLTVE